MIEFSILREADDIFILKQFSFLWGRGAGSMSSIQNRLWEERGLDERNQDKPNKGRGEEFASTCFFVRNDNATTSSSLECLFP